MITSERNNSSILWTFHIREAHLRHKDFTDLWQKNQGQKLTDEQFSKLNKAISYLFPKMADEKLQDCCDRRLTQAMWYAFRPIEQCRLEQTGVGRGIILSSALFANAFRLGWEELTDYEKESCSFRLEKDMVIPTKLEKSVASPLPVERHIITYDTKASSIPSHTPYSLHMFSLLLGLIPADKNSQREFHNAIVHLLLECHDLGKINLVDPVFYDARSLHKLIEHCRLVYLQAQENQKTTGIFAAERIVETPLFDALLHSQHVTSATCQLKSDKMPVIEPAVAKAQQWAADQLQEHKEQMQALFKNSAVQRWLCGGYYPHTLPAVMALYNLNVTDLDGLGSCLDRTYLQHEGLFHEKFLQQQSAARAAPVFDKDSKIVKKSPYIFYDVNGIKPKKSLNWYHFFVQTVLLELPHDKWSFHNAMMGLLMELNDTDYSHGLNDPVFFDPEKLNACIEDCRKSYLQIKNGEKDLESLLETELFTAMIKSDISGLNADMRHVMDVSSIPGAIGGVARLRSDVSQREAILSTCNRPKIKEWLHTASYVKTLPLVIVFNCLAVTVNDKNVKKLLSDEQIKDLSNKRLGMSLGWYGKYAKGEFQLLDVKKMLRALFQNAQSWMESLSSNPKHEANELKIQAGKLFAKVEKLLAGSQLDPAAPETLSAELDTIVKSYMSLTKDPLYITEEQQVCCLLSMVSNLHTFIDKVQTEHLPSLKLAKI